MTDGSTIDFSGAPAVTGYTGDSAYAGLGFNVVIEGYGVDSKGAIYKGKYDGPYDLNAEGATSTANRIVLPNVELTNSASVKVEAGETLKVCYPICHHNICCCVSFREHVFNFKA